MEVDSIDELGGGTGTDAIKPPMPSSANDILATIHLQERCFERNIPSFQLDAAIKYGSRTESVTHNGNRCWKFNYGGITYVTDYESFRVNIRYRSKMPICGVQRSRNIV